MLFTTNNKHLLHNTTQAHTPQFSCPGCSVLTALVMAKKIMESSLVGRGNVEVEIRLADDVEDVVGAVAVPQVGREELKHLGKRLQKICLRRENCIILQNDPMNIFERKFNAIFKQFDCLP